MRYLLIVLLLALPAWAQESSELDNSLFGGESSQEGAADNSDDSSSDDDLFGDSFFSDVEEDENANPANDLLTSETVRIGGDFRVEARLDLGLNPEEDEDAFNSGLVDLNTQTFLDARPDSDFRALVKGDIGYSSEGGAGFGLSEAFADIAIADTVYIRAGKQTVNWGVGFFFSPANLINIETIDPENPEEELSGPVAIKAQLPLGVNNATGYLTLDDLDSGNDIGLAARYEFLLEGFEVTAGAIWQNKTPWAIMATATGAVGDVSVFGEVVLEGGSDKVFIIEDDNSPLSYSAKTSDSLYLSTTLGARYSYTTEDERFTVSGTAQYYFNGLGYTDTSVFTENPDVVGALLGSGELSFDDLTGRGQHYAAASLSAPELAETDLVPSTLWVANLSDGSGFGNLSVNYDGLDYLTPTFSYRYSYGAEGAEYSPRGPNHSLSLGLTVSGAF